MPRPRIVRGLEIAAGLLLLWIAAWKVAAWPQLLDSLVAIEMPFRRLVALGLTVGEFVAGLGVLLSRRRAVRGAILVAYASTLAGGRMVLDLPDTCYCLGPALRASVGAIVLLAVGFGGLALILRNRSATKWRLCALAPVGFALGVTVGVGVELSRDWSVDGEVGTTPGRYSLSLRASGDIRLDAVRAKSSCMCLSVVGVDGPRIEVVVREPIPIDLEPYLTVWFHAPGVPGLQRLEVPVPVAGRG